MKSCFEKLLVFFICVQVKIPAYSIYRGTEFSVQMYCVFCIVCICVLYMSGREVIFLYFGQFKDQNGLRQTYTFLFKIIFRSHHWPPPPTDVAWYSQHWVKNYLERWEA